MDLLGIILKPIFTGIFKFFKFIWTKWRIIGILSIFLIVELLVLHPIYSAVVCEKTIFVYDLEIVNVEQTDREEDKGKLLITVENKGSTPLRYSPGLELVAGDNTYYLTYKDYYADLNNKGYHTYGGNVLPAGTQATFEYDYTFYDDSMYDKEIDAKVVFNKYSYDLKQEYDIKFIPTMPTQREAF